MPHGWYRSSRALIGPGWDYKRVDESFPERHQDLHQPQRMESHPQRPICRSLRGKLWPTLDEHKITHLVINPDRSLNLLPFPLLRDAKGNLLFDHNRVSLVPSLPHFINALLRSNLDRRSQLESDPDPRR